ncbi:hypothetical protein [Pseudomonas zeae]|uniref:hypothetical protein n=1 Tax=Pseudomonas zeae TaxID=2745510 RepID=UPI0039DF6930
MAFSAFSYAGPAALLLLQEDGTEHKAQANVTLRQTPPGPFELSVSPALTAGQAPVWVRVTLPGGETFSGAVRERTPSSLTFDLDAEQPA